MSPVPESVILMLRIGSALSATALQDHAVAEGHDLLVVGCRGRGMAKLVLGSCASRLACSSRVPVMLIPEEPAAAVTELRVPDLDTISA